jgi:hypothetical protein
MGKTVVVIRRAGAGGRGRNDLRRQHRGDILLGRKRSGSAKRYRSRGKKGAEERDAYSVLRTNHQKNHTFCPVSARSRDQACKRVCFRLDEDKAQVDAVLRRSAFIHDGSVASR